MTLENDIGCLKTIRMFQNVDPARLKLIALMSERVEYADGDIIMRQGQKTDAVYFLLSGEVDLTRNTTGNPFHALSLERGSFFGSAALLASTPYPGDMIAKGHVVALKLSRELFYELMQSVPEFALAVARDLAARIRDLTTRAFEPAA
jgi:CRP-like cAMP-binding protein